MPIIAISNRTIVAWCLVLAVVVMVVVLRDVVVLVFVAAVLATALQSTITRVVRIGVSRRIGVAVMLLVAAGVVAVLVATIIPLVATNVADFMQALPGMFNRLQAGSTMATLLQRISTSGGATVATLFARLGANIFPGVLGVFSGLLSVTALIALIYYFTVDERNLRTAMVFLVPHRLRPLVEAAVANIELRLGHWLRGQLLLGLIIGTAVTLGLLLLHVKYALALGLIAGVTELIPTIGPYLGMVPAILVGLSQSPLTALLVFILYWVVQQSENNFLVPRIMSKATGLNPIVVLIGILIGAKVAGIVGIILAVPLIIIISSGRDVFLTEREGVQA